MRRPSTDAELLAWHRAAMAGEAPPMHDGDPQVGWYRLQQVRNGPFDPVTIWCDQPVDPETGELTGDEVMRADVFGDPADAAAIWTYLTPISRAEHDRLFQWRLANQHRLHSRQRVDLAAAPTLPR